jgi:signal transduction histidine kinase
LRLAALTPRTLFGQILLALVLGLVALQLLGVWVTLGDRTRVAEHLLAEHAGHRIAGIAAVLDAADAIDRAKLARALDVPPTRIALDRPWQDKGMDTAEALELANTVRRHLERPLEVQIVTMERLPWQPRRQGSMPGPAAGGAGGAPADAPPAGPGGMVGAAPDAPRPPPPPDEPRGPDDAGRGPAGPAVPPERAAAVPEPPRPREAGPPARPDSDARPRRWHMPLLQAEVQVRLHDGTVASIRHALPEPPIEGPVRLMVFLAGSGVLILALAGWMVRRITRPLSTLANAASGLASNLDQPPIPESGPQEVARAARAFNRMQRDLKRLVDTRASALAAVSHDLRLPLTRVRLRLERFDDEKLKGDIEGDLADMDAMIGHTLEFLRAGTSGEKPAKVNLDALIDGVAEDAEALGAVIHRAGSAREPIVCRPQALRRCLANLFENARRYGGGEFDVEVRDAGARVEVAIGDRGPGIPAAERERVFEPYVRLETSRARESGGTGLGLAIARAVARAHGGDVTLGDRPGGGLLAVVALSRAAFKSGTGV